MTTTDEEPWYGPYSPFISQEEKNEAINRMTWQLARWRLEQDRKAKAQTDSAEAQRGDPNGT